MPIHRFFLPALAVAAILVAGCHGRDEPEITGESGGVPVTLHITFSEDAYKSPQLRGFEKVLVRERRTVRDTTYYGPGYEVVSYHHEWVEHQPRIRSLLLGGDEPSDDGMFYWPLLPGNQTTTVPIRPGHQVMLTFRAEGGYRGTQVIGTITPTAAAGQQVTIAFDRDGVHVSPIGVAGSPPPANQ